MYSMMFSACRSLNPRLGNDPFTPGTRPGRGLGCRSRALRAQPHHGKEESPMGIEVMLATMIAFLGMFWWLRR